MGDLPKGTHEGCPYEARRLPLRCATLAGCAKGDSVAWCDMDTILTEHGWLRERHSVLGKITEED